MTNPSYLQKVEPPAPDERGKIRGEELVRQVAQGFTPTRGRPSTRTAETFEHMSTSVMRVADAIDYASKKINGVIIDNAKTAHTLAVYDDDARMLHDTYEDRLMAQRAEFQSKTAWHQSVARAYTPSAPNVDPPSVKPIDTVMGANDEVSVKARIAVTNAANGMTSNTASCPYNAYASLLFKNAYDRLKKYDAAFVDAYTTLRTLIASDSVPEDVQQAAEETYRQQAKDAKRSGNLKDIIGGLSGAATGGAK